MPHILRRVRSRKSGFEAGSAGRVRAVRDVVEVKVRWEGSGACCWQKRQMEYGRGALLVLERSATRGRTDNRRILGVCICGVW